MKEGMLAFCCMPLIFIMIDVIDTKYDVREIKELLIEQSDTTHFNPTINLNHGTNIQRK